MEQGRYAQRGSYDSHWLLILHKQQTGYLRMPEVSEEERLKRTKCIIRIINLVTGLIMVGFGIGGIIFLAVSAALKAQFFLVFSPIFMTLFGLLIIVAECNIQSLVKRVQFLQSLLGRGIFNVYMSSNVFYYFACGKDAIVWLGWTLASIMFGIGIFYIVLYCCMGGRQIQKQKEMESPTVKEQMM